MFRQLRQLLVLATAGLCLAAVTAGAGSAQPRYDALYDALRVQPSAVRAAANATSLDTAVRFGRQAIYDPYLDALRIRPRSLERILAIGSRRGRATVPQPCRRCQ